MTAIDWHSLGIGLFLLALLIATVYVVRRQTERERGR
jgi:uncharacterized membrane protein (DUF485 family)